MQVLHLINPIIIGRLIDVINGGDAEAIRTQSWMLTCAFVAVMTAIYGVNFFARRGTVHMIHRAKGEMTCEAFEHIITLPIGFHGSSDTGSKSEVIKKGVEKAISLAQSWAETGLPITFRYILSTCVLFYFWAFAGIIVSIGFPLVIGVSVLFYQFGRKHRENRQDCYEASESLVIESVQNVATVQSFGVEAKHSEQLRNIWEQVYRNGFAEMRFADIGYVVRNTAILCGFATVLYCGSNLVGKEGGLTSGAFIIVLLITTKVIEELWVMGQTVDNTICEASSIRRLRELFTIVSDVQEAPVALSIQECAGALEFQDVSFRYPGGGSDALHDFSLTIPPNSTVALVGPSGAGKSTLFSLISRLFDPDSGKVLLDGHDLRDLKLNFREHVAVVSQAINIFSGTIAENIAFGRTELSQDDIERVARIARVHDFVERLPNGYQTKVGERGHRLSGGECQRLAIARALAGDCSVILFDEATSHLDPESESLIKKAMEDLFGSRTIVIIAHRLSTIRHANEIIVMQGGRIVERGNHDSLASIEKGVYRKFLRIDAG